jgi:hypothetical protein
MTKRASPPWTSEQDEQLRLQAANGESPAAMAMRLNRSVAAIDNRARKLKIVLTPARKKSVSLDRLVEVGLRGEAK